MKRELKKLFLSAWSPAEKGLLLADTLLLGVLIGWLTSPLKNGIRLFTSDTWNTYRDIYSAEAIDEEEEKE
ncbi:MAG: hypothetical protein LUH07_15655 [Lachnospiraceae bacterium]|nr:hypothetical protein [Lachnospiraceae bacterium]